MSVQEEILQLAESLAVGATEKLPMICSAVVQNLQTRLRNGVSIDDCRESFVCAAALMSSSIVKTMDDDCLSGFDAGTLKLSFENRTDQLLLIADRLLAPWCAADDFAFCGVEG